VEETKAEETQDEDTQTEDTQVVEKADDVYTNAENTGDMPGGGMNPGWWALIGFGGAGLLAGGAAWLATRRK